MSCSAAFKIKYDEIFSKIPTKIDFTVKPVQIGNINVFHRHYQSFSSQSSCGRLGKCSLAYGF